MRKKRKVRRNYTRLYILLVFLVACVVSLAAYAAGLFDREQEAAGTVLDSSEGYAHIMVMGVDSRLDDVGRSDTLMVVTVNAQDGTAQILSLPRDSRVQIEGNGYDKINHAYAFGGTELTKKTVEALLGVPMDYYVMVDVNAFERIIDDMDGVDIDVEKRMYYEDPWDDNGGLVIDLYPGMQHMTGEKAIQYVRYRDGEGDIGRIGRQQHFMRAVLEKLLDPAILPKLPQLAEEVRTMVKTDMPANEVLAMVKLLPSVKEQGLTSAMLPGKPAYLQEVSYWLPDIAAVRTLVAAQMGAEQTEAERAEAEEMRLAYEDSLPKGITLLPDKQVLEAELKKQEEEKAGTEEAPQAERSEQAAEDQEKQETKAQEAKPSKAANAGEISVWVINESGVDGAAARMAEGLRAKGFNVVTVDTGRNDDRERTIIVTDSENTEWFYGMDFPCTIMDGGDPNEAVVYIGRDYE